MIIDKNNAMHNNPYIKVQGYEKKYVEWLKISICLILFVVTMIIQLKLSSEQSIGGIIAQLQVMVSTYLVVNVKKRGYWIAVTLNIMVSLIVAAAVFIGGIKRATPGIIIPLCTIIIVSIIAFFERRLNQKLEEVTEQKEELSGLYEEITATEEEIRQQNIRLTEYNAIMEENSEKLNYLAFIDVLTELPNRKMIINRLDFLVLHSINKQENFAVVFIDLDNFKRINDSKGHHVGDLLLQSVALRLQAMIHKEDMLGRLGGDEFALIIQRKLKESEIFEYVVNLKSNLLESFIIENTEFFISASFGISIYPQDGIDSAELLKCADTAMYKAKDSGKDGIQFFNKEMKDEILKKIEFENKLLLSLQNEEIFLVFQPQYSTDSKQSRGFEALARWRSPELGLVSPIDFIPLAEEIGFIIPLGEWILRAACKMIKFIQEEYQINVIISVNISSVQIMDPSFVQMVRNVLEETQSSGNCLELEVTESVFISSMDYVVGVFNELKKIGVKISLDDFGTGYSSFSYLQKLPIDILKIDKSFIDSIDNTNSSNQMVGSIISLVHKMKILVVAEGVENEQQLDYLKEHNCDYIQGYLWGKPLGEKDLFQLLQQLGK
ncbi:MAG: putative bifunctional diguanylate cyclase/phosphodiesterase [Mobilitalea sp.]